MIRRRTSPDGLPFRLYARIGKHVTTWRYKHHDGTNEILASALTSDKAAVAKAKREAIEKATELNDGTPVKRDFSRLKNDYFEWQESLPLTSERRKAESTLAGNKQEVKWLCKVFGTMHPDAITTHHLYQYQDKREQNGAGLSANKEIALMSAIFEFGRARGYCLNNPAKGIKRVPTNPSTRRVEFAEIEFVATQARTMGPAQRIMALAAKAAWLTVRRPTEILDLARPAISDDGIRFTAGKRKAGQAQRTVLIRWSDELKATIDEALTIKRHKSVATAIPRLGDKGKIVGAFRVFGNLEGQRYSKSGWGSMWRKMMDAIKAEHPEFVPFTLKDCRPGGVTAKEDRGDQDTSDATMHVDSRMVKKVYDRRKDRKADPAR